MLRTAIRRNVAQPGYNKFMGGAQGGSGSGPQGKYNMMMFLGAAAGFTGLAYFWGYRDVEKRHAKDGFRPVPK